MADITATPANNGIPGAIQMPQGSGATSIDENGVARNIKGNAVGNVQTAADPYASYGGSAAPATNATTDPYASYGGQATNATSEDPYAAYQKTPEQEYKELPWYKRLGKRFASAWGVPETEEEATPTGTDYALMATGAKPLTDAAKMIYGYGKTAIQGAHEGGQEMGEAFQNVKEGGPVGVNIGKFIGGELHAVLSATPFVGPVVERGGQDWSNEDYAGAVGDMLGAITQIEGHNITEPILRTNAQALKVADTKYQMADAVHNDRVRELDVHTEQVKAANDAAVQAKEAERDGTGTTAQTTAANNAASEAAAQAKKAAQALNDAYEAKQKASYDRETAARKLARGLQKDQDKVNEKQTKASAAAREDSMKSAPSADSGPAKYSQRDWEITRGYEEAEHANEPINNIQERAEALQKISDDIDNKVGGYVQRYADEPITTNVHMDVRDALAENPRADFVEKGMAALEPYNLTDPSMSEAQEILTQLNAENRGTLKKNFWDVATALRVDPEFAARYAAADSLRAGMDGTLVDHGIEGIRELRQDQSSIIRVKNAVDKVAAKGGQILRQSGQSGLTRKLAGWGIRKAGNVVGGGIGTMFGHPVIGTMVGGDVASHIGAPYLKGDISRDMLHQRSMKVTGAGVPTTEITGPGTPPTRPGFAPPPPPTDALSQRDMLQLQREGGELHGQLAALYPNVPIDSPDGTYTALEQRFLQDMSDKTRNGQKLESNESKLRDAIIKQDVADRQAVQEMQQEQAEKEANGDKPPVATLPKDYEPVMQMRGRMQKGMDTQKGLVHDYVHAYFGDLLFGDKLPSEGILSHLHPDADGNLAIAAFDWKNFEDEEGYLDPKKIAPHINDFAALYLSGGIANDLWHGIPLGENLHLGADMYQLERMMNALKIPDAQQTVILQTALVKVVGELTKPGVQEVFHDHAAVREPGLDAKMHASPERIKQIVADLKGVDYEEGNESPSGNEGANGETEPRAEGREGKGATGQDEGQSKEAVPEAVGREPKGNAEGAGKGAEGREERIRAENPSVQEIPTEVAPEEAAEEKAKEREKERQRAENPALSEAPELTHRATEKGGEVRLDSEQEGQTKNRGLLKYTKNADGTAAVTAVNLDQHFRGQGLGQQMYERAADELRKQGVTSMTSDLGGQTSFDAGKVWDNLSKAHPGEIEKFENKAGSPGYRWNLGEKIRAETKEIPQEGGYQIPTEKHLSTPDGKAASEATVKTMRHELGHYMVGHNEGYEAKGILRHTHPDMPSGANAGVSWNTDDLFDRNTGRIETEKVPGVIRMAMGGVAQDEISGIPRTENRNFSTQPYIGDGALARRILREAGYSDVEAEQMMHQAVDDAKKHLTQPAVSDIIKENEGTREKGLSNQYHYSPARLKAMGDEAARRINESNNGAVTTKGIEERAGNVPGGKGEAQGATGPRVQGQGKALRPENPAFGELPPERTTGNPEHDAAIKAGGGIPGGVMKGDPSIGLPELTLFHDPTSGSTLALKTGEGVTPEKVKAQLDKSRAVYAAAEKPVPENYIERFQKSIANNAEPIKPVRVEESRRKAGLEALKKGK